MEASPDKSALVAFEVLIIRAPLRHLAALPVAVSFLWPGCRAGAAGPGTPTLERCLTELRYASVPLNGDRQTRPTVEAAVNEIKCRLLVDTGWSISSIDDRAFGKLKTARELEMVPADPVRQKLDPSSLAIVEKLKLGSLELTQQTFFLKSLKRSGGMGEEAVLGGDFLIRHRCIVDCGGRRLYFRDLSLPREDGAGVVAFLERNGFVDQALEPGGLLVMACRAEVNGRTARLMVDTGAIGTVLDRGVADGLGIARTEKRQRTVRGVGKIGASWLYTAKIDSLKIGGVLMTNLDIGVADLSRWGISDGRAKHSDVDGMFGIELLGANNAVIDYPGRKLWLKKQ